MLIWFYFHCERLVQSQWERNCSAKDFTHRKGKCDHAGWLLIMFCSIIFSYSMKREKSISSAYWSSAACGNNVDCWNSNGKIQREVSNLMGQTCTEKTTHTPGERNSGFVTGSDHQVGNWTATGVPNLLPSLFFVWGRCIMHDCVSVSGSFDFDQPAQCSFPAKGREGLSSASFPFSCVEDALSSFWKPQ